MKQNLCIDTSRVFVTGFSFGGMYSYSLSVNHQKDIRAAVGIGPANYNICLPPKTHQPIAWMQTTGMSDGDPLGQWDQHDPRREVHRDRTRHRQWVHGAGEHSDLAIGPPVCYDFEGCRPGYPVKACTFNGGHTNIANDSGTNTNWIPQSPGSSSRSSD